MRYNILIVFGTRPEAIKMAPIVLALKKNRIFNAKVCVTGQHREMLQGVLKVFDIEPDFDLNVMKNGQDLVELTSIILIGLRPILINFKPELVLVHGDTTTAFAASLASFYLNIPIGHVEAGLRTGNINSPWPEEANRRLVGSIAKYHFAPTQLNRSNLISEGVLPENVYITGNTVIDSLNLICDKIRDNEDINSRILYRLNEFGYKINDRKFILMTGHRRENFGEGLLRVFNAIKILSDKFPEVDFVYPVHLNPRVSEPAKEFLNNISNIYLVPPLDYEEFVYLMSRSYLIITDSGGIQEEALSLGKPVIVTRSETERSEGVLCGAVKLVGTDTSSIVNSVQDLLENVDVYNEMRIVKNPYGDGQAATRIVEALINNCTHSL